MTNLHTGARWRGGRQSGASLVVSLLMLTALMLLGMSATQISLQNEKAARNDRDRQVAFQAAEAALLDAELDIQNSPSSTRGRSGQFSNASAYGFPTDPNIVCIAGESSINLGLCSRRPSGKAPAWQEVNFLNIDSATTQSVPYGKFTDQTMTVSSGNLSKTPPRYVIELLPFAGAGLSAEAPSYIYRITAIGFGVRPTTQVVLQSFFRKES